MRQLSSFYITNFNGVVTRGIKTGLGAKSFNFFKRALILLKLYLVDVIDLASFLFIILIRLRPFVSFRIKKFKPSISYLPQVLTYKKSFDYCYKWLFQSARLRLDYSIPMRLFLELIYTFYNKSTAIALRRQHHLLAFSYKKNFRVRFKRRFKKPQKKTLQANKVIKKPNIKNLI